MRTRTVFLAKVAAIATALGVAIVALNIFTGLTFPFFALPGNAGWVAALRSFAGYWLAMAASGLFVCCAMLALQGLAAQLLPYRLFLRVSSFLQLAAFFGDPGGLLSQTARRRTVAALVVVFRTPAAAQRRGALPSASRPRTLVALGRVQCGRRFVHPGLRAQYSQRSSSSPTSCRAGHIRPPRLSYAILRRPVDRAIVLFTARTIARSRQHRLFLAAYAGIGLAIAFAYARDLLYGTNDPYARKLAAHWNQLNAPLLMAGVVLLCFAVAGARAIFSLPVSLRANWVFQLTAVHAPRAYFAAVRKALFAVTVLPIWIVCAAAYFLIWPARFAAQHMLVLSHRAVLSGPSLARSVPQDPLRLLLPSR